MVPLTREQQETLSRRRGAFDSYFAESMPALANFLSDIGAANPTLVVNDPAAYIAVLDQWLRTAGFVVPPTEQERIWLISRLGYFIGYVLTQRHGGCWFVDDQPESRWFARYVVGQFHDSPNVRVDPNHVAAEFVDHRSHRSLEDLFTALEAAWASESATPHCDERRPTSR
jgi:hypothetical protein